jgi:hypothetical protein
MGRANPEMYPVNPDAAKAAAVPRLLLPLLPLIAHAHSLSNLNGFFRRIRSKGDLGILKHYFEIFKKSKKFLIGFIRL